MVVTINRFQILGNIANDVTVRQLKKSEGVACNFQVVTNTRYLDNEGNTKEKKDFHEISFYGKYAEISSKILKKGNRVYIEGEMRTTRSEKGFNLYNLVGNKLINLGVSNLSS